MDSNFLRTVTSSAGMNCFAGLSPDATGKVRVTHEWVSFADTKSAEDTYQKLVNRGKEVYFATGAFRPKDDGKYARTAVQVCAMRAFYLDLDAGPRKFAKHGDTVYQTQQDAINALYSLLSKGELPTPTYVVSSGEGLHIYWAATEDIIPQDWDNAAAKLKQYCTREGLKQDPTRTSDKASILRPVGALHSASGNTVTILQTNSVFSAQELLQKLNMLPVALTLSAPHSYMTSNIPTNSSMFGVNDYQASAFGKIIELEHYEKMGCKQLMNCYMNQAQMPEPLWFAALSVAQFCIDRGEWVHKLSSSYPSYSYEETEEKASHCKGPAPCEIFASLNPGGCVGCPHRGKISNPIILGYNPAQRPQVVTAPLSTDTEQTDEFVIPSLPYPFFRQPNGGIWLERPIRDSRGKPTEEMEVFCVCPYDVYIHERIMDGGRQRYWCRYHSPHDGVIEFELDSDIIHTLNEQLKSRLTGIGLPLTNMEQWKDIVMFLNLRRAELINNRAALESIDQLGWTARDEFVLGDTVLTKNGPHPAPLGDRIIAKKMAGAYKLRCPMPPEQGIDEWNAVLAAMYPGDTALASQFIVCTAFGAPFAARFGLESHSGGIISLASAGSGRGKTFTCQVALRVFANPTDLTYSSKTGTTPNALMTTLGYVNSLPILRDEITEMSPEEVVDLVYDSTRLGDKERSQGSDNDIRANRCKWRTFFYTTSNTSLYDMVAARRDQADGPTRRITEIMVEPLRHLQDPTVARKLAQRLEPISGLAGRELLEWMVIHFDEAATIWEKTYQWFVKSYGVSNEERYWVTHLVTGCVGAVIGHKLGLHPFPAAKVMDYAGRLLGQLRQRMGIRTAQTGSLLAQLIQQNLDHTLYIDGHIDGLMQAACDLPRQAAYIRIERANKMMYISPIVIRRWCQERGIIQSELEVELTRRGGIPNHKIKLLANTKLAGTADAQPVWRVPLLELD